MNVSEALYLNKTLDQLSEARKDNEALKSQIEELQNYNEFLSGEWENTREYNAKLTLRITELETPNEVLVATVDGTRYGTELPKVSEGTWANDAPNVVEDECGWWKDAEDHWYSKCGHMADTPLFSSYTANPRCCFHCRKLARVVLERPSWMDKPKVEAPETEPKVASVHLYAGDGSGGVMKKVGMYPSMAEVNEHLSQTITGCGVHANVSFNKPKQAVIDGRVFTKDELIRTITDLKWIANIDDPTRLEWAIDAEMNLTNNRNTVFCINCIRGYAVCEELGYKGAVKAMRRKLKAALKECE